MSRVFEKLIVPQLVKNSLHFMEPEVSLLLSQEPATGPSTEPDEYKHLIICTFLEFYQRIDRSLIY
jgi:hypothetical protein